MWTRLTVLACVLTPVAAGVALAGPVTFPVAQGGTGNRYEVVLDGEINYPYARQAAESAGGHLATITTPAEQAFIEALLISAEVPTGSYWFGLERQLNRHIWTTGEAFSFENFAYGEPNDFADSEDVGQIYWSHDIADDLALRRGKWNDAPIDGFPNASNSSFPTMDLNRGGYVVEFEVPVVEPGNPPPVAIPLPTAVFAAPLTAIFGAWAVRRKSRTV
jgi:hypothetical protein